MREREIGLWMYRNQGGDIIQESLKKRLMEHDVTVVNDFDLRRCYVENGRVITHAGYDLSNLSVLYHMNADEQSAYHIHILEALEKSGVRLINSYAAFLRASDKFIANLLIRKAGVRVPPAVLLDAATPRSIVRHVLNEWKAAVVKPRFSFGGKGILKFDNASALIDFIEATGKFYVDFYLEKYIPFADKDYRVEILDSEYLASYSRGLRHEFKTNMSAAEQSCDGLFLANPKSDDQLDLALRAAHAVELDATIVDMVKSSHDDLFYVLEVNPMLGIFVQAANALMGIVPVDHDAYEHASDTIKLEKLARLLLRQKEPYDAINRTKHR